MERFWHELPNVFVSGQWFGYHFFQAVDIVVLKILFDKFFEVV
jgi:hypothetical protein